MSRKENPVDYVLDRMVEVVLGQNANFRNHAEALGVPAETIKSWRRRREVPSGRLAEFARDWKVSLDWLMRGNEEANPPTTVVNERQQGISYGDRVLLDKYHQCSEADQQIVRATVSALAAKNAPLPPVRKSVAFGVQPKAGPVKYGAGEKKRPLKPESLAGAEKTSKKGS